MKQIKRFVPGDSERTAFSADVMNEIIDALNAVLNMRGEGGTKVYAADAGYVIYSSGSLANVSGSLTGSSSTIGGGDVWL